MTVQDKVILKQGRKCQKSFYPTITATAQQLNTYMTGLEFEKYIVFWDQKNRSGEQWTDEVVRYIRRADVVVVIISPNSVGSFSVQNEIQFAYADCEKKVIPLQIVPKSEITKQERIGLWLLVRVLQRVNAWPPHDPLVELIKTLRREGFHPHPMSDMSQLPRNDNIDGDDMDWALTIPAPKPPPPPSGGRIQILIELPGTLDEFDEHEREGFVHLLANLAKINPGLVQIIAAESGSVRVTVEMPESIAYWLVEAKERNDEVAQRLSIRAISIIKVTPAKQTVILANPLSQLRNWLATLSMPQRLIGVGTLAVLVLALVLWPLLAPQAQPTTIGLCSDLTLSRGPCTSGTTTAWFGGESVSGTLSGPEEVVPRVITPRGGKLLTLTPAVRWMPVVGTTSYTITLSQGVEQLWYTVVTDTTELSYPHDGAPALVRGQGYRFGVSTAIVGPERGQALGFTVLTAEEAATLAAEIEALPAQGVDPETYAVLRANLYAQHELYAEALELLTPLAATTTQPVVELLRGNLYVTIGLVDLAQEPYERAVTLAEVADDPLAQALAQARLGDIATFQGDLAMARVQYEASIQHFESLGDTATAAELRERLQSLP